MHKQFPMTNILYVLYKILFLSVDVEGIKYVINYDYPNSSEDYIHRIGRTARSDTTGTSYAFFTPSNSRQARDLVSVLREANQVRLLIIYKKKMFVKKLKIKIKIEVKFLEGLKKALTLPTINRPYYII